MVTLTLKAHHTTQPGFNNRDLAMKIPYVKYDDTLRNVIDQLNQFRGPDCQINHLYNPLGQEIGSNLWDFKIKEDLSLYIDQPF